MIAERPAPARAARTIYLVGFMRAGKSTLGARLAAELGLTFLDLDRLVEERCGRTIGALWDEAGEAGFRAQERACLAAIAGREAVVTLGGGTTVDAGNRRLVGATGLVLWVRVDLDVIWSRAKGDRSGLRPLWRDQASLRELYREREPAYAFAHTVFEPGAAGPAAAARELARRVRALAPEHGDRADREHAPRGAVAATPRRRVATGSGKR